MCICTAQQDQKKWLLFWLSSQINCAKPIKVSPTLPSGLKLISGRYVSVKTSWACLQDRIPEFVQILVSSAPSEWTVLSVDSSPLWWRCVLQRVPGRAALWLQNSFRLRIQGSLQLPPALWSSPQGSLLWDFRTFHIHRSHIYLLGRLWALLYPWNVVSREVQFYIHVWSQTIYKPTNSASMQSSIPVYKSARYLQLIKPKHCFRLPGGLYLAKKVCQYFLVLWYTANVAVSYLNV